MKHALLNLSVASVLSVLSAPAEPALRLHWTFDVETGRGEVDASGSGHHALLLSSANPRQHPPTSREPGKGIFGGAARRCLRRQHVSYNMIQSDKLEYSEVCL